MNSSLLFHFTVNKENNTIEVIREFDADLKLVWQAWTTPELLAQWWAPKPYGIQTKSFDFRPDGTWLYAMIGPVGLNTYVKGDAFWVCPLDPKGFQNLWGLKIFY